MPGRPVPHNSIYPSRNQTPGIQRAPRSKTPHPPPTRDPSGSSGLRNGTQPPLPDQGARCPAETALVAGHWAPPSPCTESVRRPEPLRSAPSAKHRLSRSTQRSGQAAGFGDEPCSPRLPLRQRGLGTCATRAKKGSPLEAALSTPPTIRRSGDSVLTLQSSALRRPCDRPPVCAPVRPSSSLAQSRRREERSAQFGRWWPWLESACRCRSFHPARLRA